MDEKPLTPGYRPPAFQYALSTLLGIVAVAGVVAWMGPANYLLGLGGLLYAFVGLLYTTCALAQVYRK